MSFRHLACTASVLALLPGVAYSQSADEQAVLTVVRTMFDGMRSADSAAVRAVFAPGARFASVNARSGTAAIQYDTVGGWIRGIANSNRRWDEQIYDVQVKVDGDMALVWAPYTFYLDNAVRHCGVDAIALLKGASGWKVTQLSDTQRRENCPDPLRGH
jgi:ketosteroid isomerase-like protein